MILALGCSISRNRSSEIVAESCVDVAETITSGFGRSATDTRYHSG
jgi:hypothetical protein